MTTQETDPPVNGTRDIVCASVNAKGDNLGALGLSWVFLGIWKQPQVVPEEAEVGYWDNFFPKSQWWSPHSWGDLTVDVAFGDVVSGGFGDPGEWLDSTTLDGISNPNNSMIP